MRTDMVLPTATRRHGGGGYQGDDDVGDDVGVVISRRHQSGARPDAASVSGARSLSTTSSTEQHGSLGTRVFQRRWTGALLGYTQCFVG